TTWPAIAPRLRLQPPPTIEFKLESYNFDSTRYFGNRRSPGCTPRATTPTDEPVASAPHMALETRLTRVVNHSCAIEERLVMRSTVKGGRQGMPMLGIVATNCAATRTGPFRAPLNACARRATTAHNARLRGRLIGPWA